MRSFDELLQKASELENKAKVAVAWAADQATIKACNKAREKGLAEPVLIGDVEEIKAILFSLNIEWDKAHLVQADSADNAAILAVKMAKENQVDAIMKGLLDTKQILKAVVNKETGIGTGKLMSHVVFNDIPSYHKLLLTSDGGMVTYPDLEQKEGILINGIDALRAVGVERPKVGILAAVEKVNPNMPETVDAAELAKRADEGKYGPCDVAGPISFDLAYNKEASKIKKYNHPVAGDVDMLLVPNIVVGNVLGKSLVEAAKGKMAGFIAGAKVPIILTSRGSTDFEKIASMALCAIVSQ